VLEDEEGFVVMLWIEELGLVRLGNPLQKRVPFYKNSESGGWLPATWSSFEQRLTPSSPHLRILKKAT